MGLTIHWDLKSPRNCASNDIENALKQLRDFALTLPVAEVSDIKYYSGQDTEFNRTKDDSDGWLKIQAGRWLRKGNCSISQSPVEFFALSIWPGEGCEEANFILARYPRCKVWQNSSFCKTQYAADFVGCHLAVIALLDFAKKLGILKSVSDEGEYWQTRDLAVLGHSINESSAMIRGIADALKGNFDGNIVCAIDKTENYMTVSKE